MDKQLIRAIFNGVCASGEGGAMTQPAKHTPGPWFANQSEMEAHSCKVEIRTTNGAYLICSDAGYQNAPLIAAAPAMYEALRLAVVMHPHNETFRQALAQAEGGQ